jgi:hypothetical protein
MELQLAFVKQVLPGKDAAILALRNAMGVVHAT